MYLYFFALSGRDLCVAEMVIVKLVTQGKRVFDGCFAHLLGDARVLEVSEN